MEDSNRSGLEKMRKDATRLVKERYGEQIVMNQGQLGTRSATTEANDIAETGKAGNDEQKGIS
jgi:hypothetical protein